MVCVCAPRCANSANTMWHNDLEQKMLLTAPLPGCAYSLNHAETRVLLVVLRRHGRGRKWMQAPRKSFLGGHGAVSALRNTTMLSPAA